mmetsp:Transcript_16342/g.33662  ORF Transcript_16342/g.33662 Transcript_16342/m.33662 type:complete len:353 (+) Transcript_16342:807-1865(+)
MNAVESDMQAISVSVKSLKNGSSFLSLSPGFVVFVVDEVLSSLSSAVFSLHVNPRDFQRSSSKSNGFMLLHSSVPARQFAMFLICRFTSTDIILQTKFCSSMTEKYPSISPQTNLRVSANSSENATSISVALAVVTSMELLYSSTACSNSGCSMPIAKESVMHCCSDSESPKASNISDASSAPLSSSFFGSVSSSPSSSFSTFVVLVSFSVVPVSPSSTFSESASSSAPPTFAFSSAVSPLPSLFSAAAPKAPALSPSASSSSQQLKPRSTKSARKMLMESISRHSSVLARHDPKLCACNATVSMASITQVNLAVLTNAQWPFFSPQAAFMASTASPGYPKTCTPESSSLRT